MTLPSPSADRAARRGLLARLRRPREAGPAPTPQVDHGLWTVDRLVRVLATACERENRAVPVAHAITVGPETVRLHLRTPDERPPAGWSADFFGRTWQAQLRPLQTASVADSVREPYPRLVPLGTGSTGFVLLNLSQAGGVISLEGDARQARTLVQDWTRDLTTSPWSRGARVVRVGFRPGTAEPVGSFEAQSLVEAEAALADPDGGVLMMAALPGGRDRERVYGLANDPEGRWSVVVVGRVEHPRWRFTIDASGVVDTGLLDEPVAHRPGSAPPPASAPRSTDAGAAAVPAGGGAAGPRPTRPLFTPRRTVLAAVAATCVAGAALFLTLGGASAPSRSDSATPAAASRPSDGQGTPRGTAAASPTPSHQATGSPDSLVNSGTGKCLSGAAGTDGTPLVLWACDSEAAQKWEAAADGTIRSKGLCMDAAWGASTPGTVVQVANCSGNPAQRFSLRGDGTIYSTQANLCVAEVDDGAGIRLSPCVGSPAEAFKRG